jgi:hypothetical protein
MNGAGGGAKLGTGTKVRFNLRVCCTELATNLLGNLALQCCRLKAARSLTQFS